MDTLVLFLVKSIAVSGILTAWYWLALRNKNLHQYNRFFLLFILYASIQVPLLHVPWFLARHASSPLLSSASIVLQTMNDKNETIRQVANHATAISMDADAILLSVAMLISLLLLLILLVRVSRIIRMSRRYMHETIDGVELIYTDLQNAPFSFLNLMFWRNDISLDSENGRLIFRHEQAHIRQGHTCDKLACQLLTCIFWMNPFYWLIQKELNMVHEFIADDAAINADEPEAATETFARLMLQTHNYGAYITPEHRFFSSPIKRRLIMLQTNKSMKRSALRRLAVLPLIAGTVLIFAFSPHKEHKSAAIKADKKIVLVLDPGHGGMDQGGSSGLLKEKDLNLNVAKRISELAPDYNIEAHLLRNTDEYISLADRVKMSDNLHPDCFISIHVDDRKGMDQTTGTFDIAVNAKNARAEESKKLAYAIYKNMIRPDWEQGSAATEKSLYVLRENAAPAILIELGDIKNKVQMRQLADDSKLDELCSAILKGVVEANKK